MPRAAASSACSDAVSLWPAGRRRQPGRQCDQRRRLGHALVLPQLAGAHEAQALVEASPFGGGMQQHRATLQPFEQRAHQPVAERRPWQAGDTTTRPMVAWRSPQRQRSAVPTSLAVALGDDALGMGEDLGQIRGAVRPAQFGSQCMHERQVGSGHGSQRHAVESGCVGCLGRHGSLRVQEKRRVILADIGAWRQTELALIRNLQASSVADPGFAIRCGSARGYAHKCGGNLPASNAALATPSNDSSI